MTSTHAIKKGDRVRNDDETGIVRSVRSIEGRGRTHIRVTYVTNREEHGEIMVDVHAKHLEVIDDD